MPAKNALMSLLQMVRNRVWMQALLDNGSLGLAAGACLLLAGGLLHIFSYMLPTGIWLLLAPVPAILLLIFALLYRRPTLPSSARIADRWCHGQELFTSALPLTTPGHPTRFATEGLVIARASELAAEWRTLLPLQRPLHIPAYNLLSLILVGVSLFLLTLPTTRAPLQDTLAPDTKQLARDRQTQGIAGAGPSLQQQLQHVLQTREINGPASELTNRDAATPQAGDSQAGQRETAAMDSDSTPEQAGPAASDESGLAETGNPGVAVKSPPESHTMSSGKPGGPGGNDTAAWTGSSDGTHTGADTADILAAPGSTTRFIEFARRPASNPDAAQSGTTGSELDKLTTITAIAAPTGITIPAAVRSMLLQHSGLEPADRDLAANYFKRINIR